MAKWQGAKREKGVAKWRAMAVSAAKQSRRSWVPEVRDVQDTAGIVALIREVVADGGLALLLHEDAAASFSSIDFSTCPQVLFVIGPEGGLAPDEVAEFTQAGGAGGAARAGGVAHSECGDGGVGGLRGVLGALVE